MTQQQKFETIGQCIDWLNTEAGKNDRFSFDDGRGSGDQICSNYALLADFFFIHKDSIITHIPHEAPYDMDMMQAMYYLTPYTYLQVDNCKDYHIALLSDGANLVNNKSNEVWKLFNWHGNKDRKFRPYTPNQEG